MRKGKMTAIKLQSMISLKIKEIEAIINNAMESGKFDIVNENLVKRSVLDAVMLACDGKTANLEII